jgi:hypothetical protein
MILRTVMFAAGLTLIPAVVNAVGWHSRKRCRRPGSADECRRQYHVAAKADRVDDAMHRFMDAALADVEGWTE